MIRSFTKFCEKILYKSNKLVNIYDLYYRDIVKKEIVLADIKNTDKVLIVGGGAVPCTAINIASKTNAKVDIIDIDEEAIKSSSSLIKRLGLEDRVKVYLGNGRSIDVSNYDVVHIALQVNPKEEIIDNVWSKSKVGTRLIIRQPKKILKSFYSNISYDYLSKIDNNIKAIYRNNLFNTMDKSLLIVKS
ncbi:MAG TPA: nicotianamine synthase family protein [Tissierellaceae bacterium]